MKLSILQNIPINLILYKVNFGLINSILVFYWVLNVPLSLLLVEFIRMYKSICIANTFLIQTAILGCV